MCERTFRRYIDRYEDEGLDGLRDKRLEQVSSLRAEVYGPAFNAEFAVPPEEAGSAFVPWRADEDLNDDLCERQERTVGRDNCVQFDALTLQLPADTHRRHYVKAKVKVLRHLDGTLSIWHGPRRLARYHADGQLCAADPVPMGQVQPAGSLSHARATAMAAQPGHRLDHRGGRLSQATTAPVDKSPCTA